MKITLNNATKNVKLYGLMTYRGTQTTAYIGNSMRGVVEPVSYSLSYNPKYASSPRGKLPASTRALAKALSGTGSYWSNSTVYESMTASDINKAVAKLDERQLSSLINDEDAYVSVNM